MENKIANINITKFLLEQNGLLAKKSLGQNFIVDSNIIDRLVNHANLNKETAVIEIGPGLGALTQQLIEKAGKVVSIEIDQNMVRILNDLFVDKENFTLIHSDILDYDLEDLVVKLKEQYKHVMIVANLPYYITSEILTKLFLMEDKVESVMVMVQREFAQRLTASKNTKDYRTLTVLSRSFYDSKIVMKISKHVFYPRPNVDSAIILMKSRDFEVKDVSLWIDFVDKCFIQKRKTIFNNLRSSFDEEVVDKILSQSNVDKSKRPAELDLDEFKKMYEVYYEVQVLCKT